jgi:peroxiredoxin Q/BCP
MLKSLFGTTLKKGQTAPDFGLVDQDGKPRKLAEFRGRWTVLYFYPKDETRGCTAEACSFRDTREDFSRLDAAVVGVSVDDVASHKAFAENHGLNFPLLSDTRKEVSKLYGVLNPLGFSNRVTFLIAPDGRIADIVEWANWSNYGPTVARRLEELRKA